MINLRPLKILIAFATVTIASLANISHANIIDLSGGSNWLSTDDGIIGSRWALGIVNPGEGIPATSPYGNTSTTALNKNKMMWYCGVDESQCTIDDDGNAAGNGPLETFYLRSFYLKADDIAGAFALIADDFLEVWLNGQFVLNAVLDENQVAGQPSPLVLEINDLDLSVTSGTTLNQGNPGGLFENILQVGWNTLAIRAMDGALADDTNNCPTGATAREITGGGLFCNYDRNYEYLFVTGSLRVSEPAPLAMFVLGLLGLVAAYKRRRLA